MKSNLVLPMKYSCVSFVVLLSGLLGCGETSPPEPTAEWIDPTEIQQGPTIHDSLPEELLTRIKKVHTTFADVDDSPLDKWIDDFKRDLDPEGNISIWEDMVVAYDSFCTNQDLQLEA